MVLTHWRLVPRAGGDVVTEIEGFPHDLLWNAEAIRPAHVHMFSNFVEPRESTATIATSCDRGLSRNGQVRAG